STDKETVTAGGEDHLTLKFVAKDTNGNPITGIADDITFKVIDKKTGAPAPQGAVTIGKVSEITPAGTYTADVTANTAGDYSIIPQYNNAPVG
ncbi:hypothetical protein FKD06_23255, partial [Serratia sp. SRS-8-S-2018]|uniref:invasin domain 3-containing protein n=1 Tax=Serratia sp. SRS-8-S-2018 TaxID=2591107 RepID=UPI0011404A6E